MVTFPDAQNAQQECDCPHSFRTIRPYGPYCQICLDPYYGTDPYVYGSVLVCYGVLHPFRFPQGEQSLLWAGRMPDETKSVPILTPGDFLNSTGEFAFLKAKISAQDKEKKKLEDELTKTRIESIRRAEASRRVAGDISLQGKERKPESSFSALFSALFFLVLFSLVRHSGSRKMIA